MPDKKSRKQESFSGHESTQTAQVRVTFFYPDYTVGLGITPSHALLEEACFRKFRQHAVGLQSCSWAVPPIGNCTLPRRLIFD